MVCAMNARVTTNKRIILSAIDTGYIDMAINFYETSLQRHNIENFLFVGLGNGTCQALWNSMTSLPCFQYGNFKQSNTPSMFSSREFNNKMLFRLGIVAEALSAGFTVLSCDVDQYFMDNPFPDLEVRK